MWNRFFEEVIDLYFRKYKKHTIEKFNPDLNSYSHDMIYSLKEMDVFLIEASKAGTYEDSTGFRFARTLVRLNINSRPIVIFKALEKEFLEYLCFADYGSIHLLPEKIESILASPVDEKPFRLLAEKYHYMDKLPIHIKVI